jgi:hypothetical protein
VFCGFGGDDGMLTGLVLLDAGDIFLGGDGNDEVGFNFGTFNGGEDTDSVEQNFGTFNGDAGDDTVQLNEVGATFNGGEEGTDTVGTNEQRHLRAVIINPSSNQGGAGA